MRICFFLAAALACAQDAPTLLKQNCLPCHNVRKQSSGLALDAISSIKQGGNRGNAIVQIPTALRQSTPLKMPPGRQLTPAQIETIEQWLAAGLPGYPETLETTPAKPTHWSFLPLTKSHTSNPSIDTFIRARLSQSKIPPSPEADKHTLLRRLHLDLTGLPPTPEEIAAFEADISPNAYESRVDKLLQNPHYGERWARHWLDQVRYADSDGGSRDEPRRIWPYRDYVINSLNADLPFSQFVTEQLAGDLLPNATDAQRIATGMMRNSLLQIEAGTDREQYRVEAVSDRVDMFGAVFLGLSTGCARCHDHKYDPISQRDYYRLFAFFNNIDEYSNDLPPFSDTLDLEITHQPFHVTGPQADVDKYRSIRSMIFALHKERTAYVAGRVANAKTDPGLALRDQTIAALKKQQPATVTLSMVMEELPVPRPAHVLLSGEYTRKGVPVTAGVPETIFPNPNNNPKQTRLDLAHWLTHNQNPLLARVTVNRIWQRYFGRGLVETENDFGRMGSKPSHPELLDFLAAEFIKNNWSLKSLHRIIVTSKTYRQASLARPQHEALDPQNILLSRQSRLRLDAEIIRDNALAASGLLAAKIGGPSVFPPQPKGAMDASQVKKTWTPSKGEDRYRRGLYTHYWRITPHPALTVFDAPNAMIACTRRTRSNTPLQALTLLNDDTFHEMALALARRAVAAQDPIRQAFLLTHSRPPSPNEFSTLQTLYSTEKDAFSTNPESARELINAPNPELAALTAVARVLLNTDEFITRE